MHYNAQKKSVFFKKTPYSELNGCSNMRKSIRTRDLYHSRYQAAALSYRTLRRVKQNASRIAKRSNRFVPFIVMTWSGQGTGKALCTAEPSYAPENICLTTNRDETLKFLMGLQFQLKASRTVKASKNRKRVARGRVPEIRGFIDFSRIKYIGTSAAVILAAIFQRARNFTGRVPPTINLHQWSDPAFLTLFELGFFETVGHIVENKEGYRETGDVRTMTLITGRNSTGLQSVSEAILDLSTFIGGTDPMRPDIQKGLNSALGEAMSNVAHHAYPAPTTESLNETMDIWWVSASADREARVLRVVVYDQGATIPVTLPKRSWFAKVDIFRQLEAISRDTAVPHPHDPDYIEYAMGVGKTQTGQDGRGEGLPQMRELLNISGAGSLMILSRGGVCCYWPDRQMTSQALSIPIEGTLIEWEIHLPKAA